MEITIYGLTTNKRARLTGRETPKAYLANVYTVGERRSMEQMWLPKSQVDVDEDDGTIDVSEWYFSNVLEGKIFAD